MSCLVEAVENRDFVKPIKDENTCYSPTGVDNIDCIHVPMNFSEKHGAHLLDDSSTVTTVTTHTADSADSHNSQNDWEFIQDIESHLQFEEEEEVTYMVPLPKMGKPKIKSLTPISIMLCKTIGLKESRNILKVLFDPGSTKTLIHRSVLPANAKLIPLSQARDVKTLAGSMTAVEMVHLRELRLPEFDKNRRIDEQKALIFDKKTRYDVILGADFLTKTGFDIKYSTGTIHWFENVRPMREPWTLNTEEFQAMAAAYDTQLEDEYIGEDWLDSYLSNTILDAKYEKADVREVAESQKHLTLQQ